MGVKREEAEELVQKRKSVEDVLVDRGWERAVERTKGEWIRGWEDIEI